MEGMPKLLVVQGRSTREEFDCAEEVVIGRSEECAVRVLDEAASRRHAAIRREGERWFAVDLGSTNGTFVNGVKVLRKELKSGDEVGVRDLTLLFVEEGAAERKTVLADREVRAAPPAPPRLPAPRMIGNSRAMASLREEIARVARTDATVLVTGETGTGKELVARALHDQGARGRGPFVAVNCAAFVETLLEAELFGHEKGAFTGADRARAGRFEEAHGGTLFLDEVGEMLPGLQAKLLRVLETLEFHRVGATRPTRVDVRILAATNRDLRAGGFREDLYFRLSVVTLRCPPLRERDGDVALLARAFLGGRPLTEAAVAKLDAYAWPGNVRELKNACERSLALARGEAIGVEDLPADVRAGVAAPADDGEVLSLREMTRVQIARALERTGGNRTRAAELLGITYPTLKKKIDEFGL